MEGIAGYFKGNQLLIDRSNFYSYNISTVTNNNIFLFKYFQISLLMVR